MKYFIKSIQILSCVIGVTIIITVVIPMIFGIQPYIVLSGSMEPEIKTGSLAYVNTKVKPEEIQPQDIISFNLGGTEVTHRVLKINDDRTFTTKGDANLSQDKNPVSFDNYKGKTVFSIPYMGRLVSKIKTTAGAYVVIVIILLNIVFLFVEKYFI